MNGVYEAIHNDSSDNELMEMGQTSPWALLPIMQEYFLPVCKAVTESLGYKKLLDYPNNFKVC